MALIRPYVVSAAPDVCCATMIDNFADANDGYRVRRGLPMDRGARNQCACSIRLQIEVSTLSALHSAVAKHETEQVEKLLTRDNVGLTDSAGNAALHVAAAFGFVDLVRLILNTGADVDQRTNDGGTPLHLACIKGHLDCVRVLVEWGADLSKETRIHKTPLMYAQSHRHKAIVKFLEVSVLHFKRGVVGRLANDGRCRAPRCGR